MYKRALILFCIFMGLFCTSFFNLDYLSRKEKLREAATNQQSYKLKIANTRGTIYDCRNRPLTGTKTKLIAAVIPSVESLGTLTPAVSDEKKEELYRKCSGKTPFTIEVNQKISSPFIKTFEVPIRYSGTTLAPHILGYLSAEGHGICAIEKIFDEYLMDKDNEIYVKYDVDASGKFLPGIKETVEDKSYLNFKGVALTLDERIEAIVEDTANKYITRGAVIVSEVPNCEIRACYSLPSFLPQSVGKYINDSTSPLLNRAFCQFNLGSIFKLVTASAALERGISPNFEYDCEGENIIDDAKFKCFNSKKHGKINLEEAMAESCNGYFIELSKKLPENEIRKTAQKFGLGEPIELAEDWKASGGVLPSEESLKNPKTLANFSFGQGKLMASPMQIIGMINAIAADGVYKTPKIIKGLLNSGMQLTEYEKLTKFQRDERIISKNTADILKKCMQSAIEQGTAQKGKPEKTEAAAKTSTAQTGIVENGRRIEQSWIAGMFPVETPKYCIVVLSEDGLGGGESCGPVFKEIIDRMYQETPEIFIE